MLGVAVSSGTTHYEQAPTAQIKRLGVAVSSETTRYEQARTARIKMLRGVMGLAQNSPTSTL
ncbi:hypothetical protein M2366_001995 [Aeromonas sp. BIGb0405]|nr:hypothetical protein [Aeromonas sp. BIGb0405]